MMPASGSTIAATAMAVSADTETIFKVLAHSKAGVGFTGIASSSKPENLNASFGRHPGVVKCQKSQGRNTRQFAEKPTESAVRFHYFGCLNFWRFSQANHFDSSADGTSTSSYDPRSFAMIASMRGW